MASELSITQAYSQYGSKGLTELGNTVRKTCIASIALGSVFSAAAIITVVLSILSCFPNYTALFPTPGSIAVGFFASGISLFISLNVVMFSYLTLTDRDYVDEYLEPNPLIEIPTPIPDPRFEL